MLTGRVAHDASFIVDARTVRFGSPIGIDPERFESDEHIDPCPNSFAAPSNRADRKLLVGVDRLDYTKGIDRRLAAFERLLDQHPDLHGTVEIFFSSRCRRATSCRRTVDYRREVQACVDRINRRLRTPDWTPVRYVLGSLAPAQLRELYCDADVMLVTSLRDGMNLVAKEFVSCRTDDDGVLVLSEFAGASEELRGALIVTPIPSTTWPTQSIRH